MFVTNNNGNLLLIANVSRDQLRLFGWPLNQRFYSRRSLFSSVYRSNTSYQYKINPKKGQFTIFKCLVNAKMKNNNRSESRRITGKEHHVYK